MRKADFWKMVERARGYVVLFERREDGLLISDCLPASDETPFDSEAGAWQAAEILAFLDPTKYVNIYVASAHDYVPVSDKTHNRYPARTA